MLNLSSISPRYHLKQHVAHIYTSLWCCGSSTDDAVTYQLIIDGLSEVLPPEVSLDHIKGSAITAGDLLSLYNLLQILLELFNIKINGQ